jgi:hypothetical protein
MFRNKELANMYYHEVLKILKETIRVQYKGEDFIPDYIYHKAAEQIKILFKTTLDMRTPVDYNKELELKEEV